MKQVLVIDLELCTGCRNCELACSVANTGTFNPSRSRIQVLKDEVKNLLLPMVCLQCDNPLCQEACPNGAIDKNDFGILTVNHDTCIGCLNCATACVYGGITLDSIVKKAMKCDLCNGKPACVDACEYGAIQMLPKKEGTKQRREKSTLVYDVLQISSEGA